MTAGSVRDALRLRLGSAVAEYPGFSEGVLRILRGYVSSRDTFHDLSLRMEDYLFNALYDCLGPAMTLPLDGGMSRRFLMSELPAAADEALFPLFEALSPSAAQYARLHDYWMSSGSPSALRALLLNYRDYLPPEESALMERIIRENVPVALQDTWLGKKPPR